MTINNITISNIFIVTLLMGHSYAWNMEKKNICREIIPYIDFNLKKLTENYNNRTLQSSSTEKASKDLALCYKKTLGQGLKILCQNREIIQQYNHNNILLALPNEMLESVVSQINPLKDGIKSALSLRSTCKHFYILPLEHFGNAYQHHTKIEKNEVLKNVLWNITDTTSYWDRRCGALILVHAGADNDARKDYTLFERAIHNNDTDMIRILFENGANPNLKNWDDPIFFSINNINILKLFAANGVNLNAEAALAPNILWSKIHHNPSPELIAFYLDHHVDAKKIHPSNGYCLLHFLISLLRSLNIQETNESDYLKIGQLLLKAAPEMVDTLDNNGKTPIDMARDIMADYNKGRPEYKASEQLIALFEKQKLINKIKKSSYRTDLSRE